MRRLAQRAEPAPRRALSVAEFAAAYGMGVTTVYEAIKRGELKSFKILSRRFIPLDDNGLPINPTQTG